jgi:hypothetical protein
MERLRARAVRCALCGREAGQVVGGVFYQAPDGPAPAAQAGHSRCGHCGGNLATAPDEVAPYVVERLGIHGLWEAKRRARRPGGAGDAPG